MASAEDWLRVGRLILDRGRANGRQLVPADWIAQMTAPSAANPNYGWQVWRGHPHAPARRYGKSVRAVVPAAEPFARDDVFYLDGSAGQRVYVIPSERMVIVRIGAPSFDWDDSRLPNLLLAGVSRSKP
jgi:CubicO group peptidase (beta-lactamase class C family)